jgi:hypothetical protein
VDERSESWHPTPLQSMTTPGEFAANVTGWQPGEAYAFRAVVQHPLIKIYGQDAKTVAR